MQDNHPCVGPSGQLYHRLRVEQQSNRSREQGIESIER